MNMSEELLRLLNYHPDPSVAMQRRKERYADAMFEELKLLAKSQDIENAREIARVTLAIVNGSATTE